MRARAVIGSILLALCALLPACGEEQDGPKVGDIIKARVDDQFQTGAESSVTLPTGRLLIYAEQPVGSATDEETRVREVVDAPSGAMLVPISWQYDPWNKGRLDGIFDATDTPIIDLVSDEGRYRLPPPELTEKGGESFYVVVDGDAVDRSLEIEFDGVAQSVDLSTGRVDEGQASALYRIDDTALKEEPCNEERWFDNALVAADFTCHLRGPVLTPYAAGEWAPEGSLWLALTAQTEMGIFSKINGLGGGANYAATEVEVKAEIDDVAPAFALPTDDDAAACPAPLTAACGWSKHLIFEVPADDGEQGPLDLQVTYRLALQARYGEWDPAARTYVDDEESIKLWGD